ncbi:MAG: DUF1629 domain-containing protein [Pseudomonadota bacterium]
MNENFYRLLDDMHYRGRWQLSEPISECDDVDPSDFTSGQAFNRSGTITVDCETGIPLDFTLSDFDVPVVSERLGRAISQIAGDDVQMVGVTVECSDDRYLILNALRLVECLDEANSVFTKWQEGDGRPDKVGGYRMVPKLVIDPAKVGGSKVFRIAGWDVALIVSEEIKREAEELGCVGLVFDPVY